MELIQTYLVPSVFVAGIVLAARGGYAYAFTKEVTIEATTAYKNQMLLGLTMMATGVIVYVAVASVDSATPETARPADSVFDAREATLDAVPRAPEVR